jgi:TetR/AcrR family transcriptional regulator, cholesterol catabolism regulator
VTSRQDNEQSARGAGAGRGGSPGARGRRPRVDGAKRAEILAQATELFGRDGYEATKWADIAAAVGVGPTALYHYFESKQHCLFVILEDALTSHLTDFRRLTADDPDAVHALWAVLEDCFDLTDQEVLRNRLLVAEIGLLSTRRTAVREEEARQAARARQRELELAWTGFLASAMERGAIPPADPRMLARAILGFHNSVWHWYRPRGTLALPAAAEFFIARTLAMAGVPLDADGVPVRLAA